jgi:hypothetical protein
VQSLALLEQNQSHTACHGDGQDNQGKDESCHTVGYDEADNGDAYRGCRPIDVATLNTHKFKGTLQPLEQWIIRIVFLFPVHDTCGLGESEEQRKCLGCRDKEDAGSDHHHDLFLENLLPNCKVLNINTPKKQKVPKETNWKQKFQKPQNENICLTYLNTEMNGNFHFLSFCAAFLKVQNQVL